MFTVRFTAPDTTGTSGKTDLAYDLALSGPTQAGCLAARSVAVPAATKGSPVTVTLDPAKLGGQWCAGTYTAKVTEIQRPVCLPGAMCPQYIRVVATVGSATSGSRSRRPAGPSQPDTRRRPLQTRDWTRNGPAKRRRAAGQSHATVGSLGPSG